MPLKLEVAGKLPPEISQSLLERAIDKVGQKVQANGIVNLKLVDDHAIRALNKKYAGLDKSTDVLSFSYASDGSGAKDDELGDIAISLETATRQAVLAKTNLETEVALLLIHGALHVLGFDHANKQQLVIMDKIQAGIMKSLNLTYRNFQWDSSVA